MEQFSEAQRDAMYANMFALFNQLYPLSPAVLATIRRHTNIVFFKRRSIILEHGKICRNCYFGLKGMVRAYYIKDDGQEITSWFMKEGDIIISVQSFFTQTESHEVLEALDDTLCISLRIDVLEEIYRKFPEFNFVGRKLTEHYYIQMENRAFSLRMDDARQRYDRLVAQHPDIITRVPIGYIASYLGISAETLSRIRSGTY
ncbi:Crp/Fnr family transcriptional regulator [Chitinophaga alhagiae]|uniref:Crp/Fnr family transcriptional regulator n=1 Tax=Chitinophaga alhagiae TaxID=2203219 RepID=A0ABN5LPP2_9BACT|nr:Crp/Fnr family transcriptional regulator [Chitinophaga alhagiae]AWO01353.1 Crp/Fnr family transcriptional regulator [Chitinophaga alhagiae]